MSFNQINPIDVNFHLQKSFEFFDKNSAEKKEIKVSPLMPIRVKRTRFIKIFIVLGDIKLWCGVLFLTKICGSKVFPCLSTMYGW